MTVDIKVGFYALIVASALLTQSTLANDETLATNETQTVRPYAWLQLSGQTWYTEMIAGLVLALPLSWLRFYSLGLGDCVKNLVHVGNDVVEALFHFNEMTMLEQGWIYFDEENDPDSDEMILNRNIYYLLANNQSLLLSVPLLYNTCGAGASGTPIVSQFVGFTSMFNEHIIESAKIVAYIDLALQMAFRAEWVLVGMMLS